MKYILRFALFFFVASAICLAQTKNCWPRIDEEPFRNFVAETIALCAAWIIYEALRPLMGQSLKCGIGIALLVLGLVGCFWVAVYSVKLALRGCCELYYKRAWTLSNSRMTFLQGGSQLIG